MKKMIKFITVSLVLVMIAGTVVTGCTIKNQGTGGRKELTERQQLDVIPEDAIYKDASYSVEERVADLMSYMTLEEKAAQMVMAERNVKSGGIAPKQLPKYPLGCILSGGGSAPDSGNTSEDWANMINAYQQTAVENTRLGIPVLYGVDAVHGNSNVYGVTIYPHNVGIGATGDLELAQRIGALTAEDVRATGANWIFAPTLGNPQNVTWGRSYECFSEDAAVVAQFGAAYVKGIQGELSSDEYLTSSKALATAKHYIGEGYTMSGMNQGNVNMTAEEFDELLESGLIEPYRTAIENGVKTVMVSYNSVDGLKCHGNKHLVTDILRGELGFEGIVVGDYNGIQQIATENNTFEEQLLVAIDAGIDVTMEPFMWKEIIELIVEYVEDGKLTEKRVDESVERILTAKFELGLFEDPYANEDYLANVGSDESREVAREAVRKSLVLLKNDVMNNGQTIMEAVKGYDNIFVAGRGADDIGMQCGGWTISWQGQNGDCTEGTTILEGIEEVAGNTKTITYSEDGSDVPADAQAAIVVLSERPYAESDGDATYKSLTFMNSQWQVIDTIREQNPDMPIIALFITGRTLTIADYIDKVDGIVCAWLPGTEGGQSADGKTKITIWTLADDLKSFGEKYMEVNDNVEVEVVVIAPGEYVDKTQTAILGGEDSIDIICGEPQMLGNMFDAGLFADLGALGGTEFEGEVIDYVYEVGKDKDGTLRALSYQVTPAGFYYRRDIAEKVFGTADPAEIGKHFESYDAILEAAKTLKDAGYRIFSSDGETNYFSGDSAWVIDGALNVDPSRVEYMDLCVELYQNDYTTYAGSWSTPWYQAMAGPVAILSADSEVNVWGSAEEFDAATEGYEKTEVFAFGLPTWGTLTMRDHYGETEGKWGVCGGPSYGFGGGTFVGISELSKNKEAAYDFINWMLQDETLDWWIDFSEGDVVSKISVLEAHKDDENPVYGNQKMYAMWLPLAEGIDYSKVTQYDTKIGDAWGQAIGKIKTGEMTREEAYEFFYTEVASAYPELTIEKTLLGE